MAGTGITLCPSDIDLSSDTHHGQSKDHHAIPGLGIPDTIFCMLLDLIAGKKGDNIVSLICDFVLIGMGFS